MQTANRLPARAGGFTLIELLVVMSIIAILVGILLPALAAARRASKDAQCLSNVRQLATANYMYAADCKVFVGYTGGIDRKKRLEPYLRQGAGGNSEFRAIEVWNCPSNQRAETEAGNGVAQEASYGFNTQTNHVRFEHVLQPVKTVFLADGGINDPGNANTATHLMSPGYSTASWSGLCRPNPRHKGDSCNVGWTDGHATLQKIEAPFYASLPGVRLTGAGATERHDWRQTVEADDTLWDLK